MSLDKGNSQVTVILRRGSGMAKPDRDSAVPWPAFGSASTSSVDARNGLASVFLRLLPVLTAGFILANAVWLHLLQEMPRVPCVAGGIALIFIGTRLILQGLAAFRRSGTHVLPYKPSLTLVTGGIYGRTRNPMYQGMGIIVLGLALLLRNDGVMVLLLPAALAIHYGLVLPEERYLERKFGPDYLRFGKQVPRYGWLFWPSVGERPFARDWLAWTAAAAGLVVAAYVIAWLTDLVVEAVEEPGVRTTALARAPVIGRASLLAAAREAGLRRSTDVKVVAMVHRNEDGRVRVDGWAAEIGGTAAPLTVLVFTEGSLAFATKTRGGRSDITPDLNLSAEAASSVAFTGKLACRPRQRLVVVATTVGNKYALPPTLMCP
jgi:protein-S-isoprenylcysteine O-methyltransferase Ste14